MIEAAPAVGVVEVEVVEIDSHGGKSSRSGLYVRAGSTTRVGVG